MTGFCRKCAKTVALDESLVKTKIGAISIRGECKHCHLWIMWVPRKDSYIVENLLHEFHNEK